MKDFRSSLSSSFKGKWIYLAVFFQLFVSFAWASDPLNSLSHKTGLIFNADEEEFITENFPHIAPLTSLPSVPASVDLSVSQYFPPVGDQGSLSASPAFAVGYYQLSYMTAAEQNDNTIFVNHLDTKHIYSGKFIYDLINQGKDAGAKISDVNKVLESNGAPAIGIFPYDGKDFLTWPTDLNIWRSALYRRTQSMSYVSDSDISREIVQLKSLLSHGYMMTFGTPAYSFEVSQIKSGDHVGEWAVGSVNGTSGDHLMTIVGYDDNVWVDVNGNGKIDAGEKGAFKVVNSWGGAWGNKGFIWIAYDALFPASQVKPAPASAGRQEALLGNMAFVMNTRDHSQYIPQLYAQVTLDAIDRSALSFTVGSAISHTIEPTRVLPVAPGAGNGAVAFDGAHDASDAVLIEDLTDLIPAGPTSMRYFVGITNENSAHPVVFKSFVLRDMITNARVNSSTGEESIGNGTLYAFVDYTFGKAVAQDSDSFTISVSSPNGTVTKSPSQSSYQQGTIVTLTAVPNSGYKFAAWGGNVSGSSSSMTILVDSNKLVTATFAPTSTSSNGSGSKTTSSGSSGSKSSSSGGDNVQPADEVATSGNKYTLSITAQPASMSVTAGNSATFHVSATGTATPSYQWMKAGKGIIGATSSTYTIAKAAASDAANYSVLVYSGYNTSHYLNITSASAALVVNQPSSGAVIGTNLEGFSTAKNDPDQHPVLISYAKDLKIQSVRLWLEGAWTAKLPSNYFHSALTWSRNGIRVIAVANFQNSVPRCSAPSDADWVGYWNRFPTSAQSGVYEIQLGNEINSVGPTTQPYVYYNGTQAQMVHLMQLAYPILHAKGYVVCAGSDLNDLNYYKGLYKLGAFNYCDRIDVHAYYGSAASVVGMIDNGINYGKSIGKPCDSSEWGVRTFTSNSTLFSAEIAKAFTLLRSRTGCFNEFSLMPTGDPLAAGQPVTLSYTASQPYYNAIKNAMQ